MDQDKKIDVLKNWIKELSWKENDERTDAQLYVIIKSSIDDNNSNDDDATVIRDCCKRDYLVFTAEMCDRFADEYTIETINIALDGDCNETVVKIFAEIHLAR